MKQFKEIIMKEFDKKIETEPTETEYYEYDVDPEINAFAKKLKIPEPPAHARERLLKEYNRIYAKQIYRRRLLRGELLKEWLDIIFSPVTSGYRFAIAGMIIIVFGLGIIYFILISDKKSVSNQATNPVVKEDNPQPVNKPGENSTNFPTQTVNNTNGETRTAVNGKKGSDKKLPRNNVNLATPPELGIRGSNRRNRSKEFTISQIKKIYIFSTESDIQSAQLVHEIKQKIKSRLQIEIVEVDDLEAEVAIEVTSNEINLISRDGKRYIIHSIITGVESKDVADSFVEKLLLEINK